MNLTFTDEQEMMRKMVRDFAENEVAPAVERMEREDRFPVRADPEDGRAWLNGNSYSREIRRSGNGLYILYYSYP